MNFPMGVRSEGISKFQALDLGVSVRPSRRVSEGTSNRVPGLGGVGVSMITSIRIIFYYYYSYYKYYYCYYNYG